ncbi:unnamed protein product, partial [Allacma fusca]
MKPEIVCFNPGGCRECLFGGSLISLAADCPEPEKSDNLLFHLTVAVMCSLLLTIAIWLAYCWYRRRHGRRQR